MSRSTKPIAKKAKRKASWHVVDGVRIFLKTGREVCLTDAAWNKRRAEVLAMQNRLCWFCLKNILGEYHVHHLKGRGRGRDDRAVVNKIKNLAAAHPGCHMEEHNQGWSKGELQWQSVRQQN